MDSKATLKVKGSVRVAEQASAKRRHLFFPPLLVPPRFPLQERAVEVNTGHVSTTEWSRHLGCEHPSPKSFNQSITICSDNTKGCQLPNLPLPQTTGTRNTGYHKVYAYAYFNH